MLMASSRYPLKYDNYTYSQIHDLLAYGAELSWFQAMCTECDESNGACIREDNKIRCRHYCYEDTPLSERSFGCKLEYYAPYLLLVAIVIGGLIGLRLLCGIPCLIGLVIYKSKKRHSSMKKSEIIQEIVSQRIDITPINYSYSEIKRMTGNFAAKLGEGPHGTVFKGKLRSGPFVAVKMMSNSSSSDKDSIAYVSMLSRIIHPNAVKLIGFCVKGEKRALVYQFIQCGSLDKHIFSANPSLSYREMFKISLGIAKGMAFLHDIKILHLGIKPENILLDEDLRPKISDSGMEKLYSSRGHKGKMGFVAPEVFYKNIGEVSSKADVYSYGILLLEMISRLMQSLKSYDNKSGEIYFPWWIYKQFCEGKYSEIFRDADEEEKMMAKKMVLVGLWCIQIRPEDRPSINEVVKMLEGGIELVQMPPMPFQRGMGDEKLEKS
ncbi:Serine/threonine protein kinase [Handroanthus impetiginosus]|uniref:Serine/threonine protein kinase n=1 Tax=Handroanthus impetiginosus TaxID=429701 RepID=A0A2G9G9I8_9LAMI|nr:Serine/threonine protein kinase [Handroanthus impetiginosus]